MNLPRHRLARIGGAVAVAALALATAARAQQSAHAEPDASIPIVEFAYQPKTITVAPGTTITWTNQDEIPHSVTFGSARSDDSGSLFDSGLMYQNDVFSFTFNDEGTYPYYCFIHPAMIAEVVVQTPDTE
jgi:plastocyanin